MISIIMPNLNKGRYVQEAIESALAQTYRDFELIAVDNGSDDESPDIIREYSHRDPRIKLLFEPRRGPGAAMNTGILAATGSLIAFLASDDVLHREKLATQFKVFRDDPGVHCCYSEAWLLDESGNPTGKLYNRDVVRLPKEFEGRIFKALLRSNFVSGGSIMIRKDCLANEMFDPRLLVAEDWDLWVRLSYRYRFNYVPLPLYGYRIHKGNIALPSYARYERMAYENWLGRLKLDRESRALLVKRLIRGYREEGEIWKILSLCIRNTTAFSYVLRRLFPGTRDQQISG